MVNVASISLLSRLLSISEEFFKRLPEKRLNRGQVAGWMGRRATEQVNQGRWRIGVDRKKKRYYGKLYHEMASRVLALQGNE